MASTEITDEIARLEARLASLRSKIEAQEAVKEIEKLGSEGLAKKLDATNKMEMEGVVQEAIKKFGKLVEHFVETNGSRKDMAEFIDPLVDIGEKVKKLTMELGLKAMSNKNEVGAAAVPYLRVVGHFVYAFLFAQMAKVALDKKDSGDDFYKAKLATSRFYFAKLLPETAYQIRAARAGSESLMALEADLF